MRPCAVLAWLAIAAGPAWAQRIAAGPEVLVCPADPNVGPQRMGCVAFGGGVYLVVWEQGTERRANVAAVRLDRLGRSLDSAPIVITAERDEQAQVGVAFAEGVFLVVWADLRTGRDYDVRAARITPKGKVLDPNGFVVAGGASNQSRPAVAGGGGGFLVVWTDWVAPGYAPRAARVSPNGRVLDAKPIAVFPAAPGPAPILCDWPRTAFCRGRWVVAWEGSAVRGRFGGHYEPLAVRLGAKGDVLDTQPIHVPVRRGQRVYRPCVAGGRGGWLLAWEDRRRRGGRGFDGCASRLTLDGKHLDAGPKHVRLGAGQRRVLGPAACFDGRNYVLAFVVRGPGREHGDTGVIARVVTENGTSPDESELVLVGGEESAAWPSVASDGQGRVLCVYSKLPQAAGENINLAARLLTTGNGHGQGDPDRQ